MDPDSKKQLIAELEELGTDGTLKELRQRMRAHVTRDLSYGQMRGASMTIEDETTPSVVTAPSQLEMGKMSGQIKK